MFDSRVIYQNFLSGQSIIAIAFTSAAVASPFLRSLGVVQVLLICKSLRPMKGHLK